MVDTMQAPAADEAATTAEGTTVPTIPAPEGSVAAFAAGLSHLAEARIIVAEVVEESVRTRLRITEVFQMIGALDDNGRWIGTFGATVPMVGVAQVLYPAPTGVEYLNHARRTSRLAKIGADMASAKSDDVRAALGEQAERLTASVNYSKRVESLADLMSDVANRDHDRRKAVEAAKAAGQQVGQSASRPGAVTRDKAGKGQTKPTTIDPATPVERTPEGAVVLVPVKDVTTDEPSDSQTAQAVQVAEWLGAVADLGDVTPFTSEASAGLVESAERVIAASGMHAQTVCDLLDKMIADRESDDRVIAKCREYLSTFAPRPARPARPRQATA